MSRTHSVSDKVATALRELGKDVTVLSALVQLLNTAENAEKLWADLENMDVKQIKEALQKAYYKEEG